VNEPAIKNLNGALRYAAPPAGVSPADRPLTDLDPILTDYFQNEYRVDELALNRLELDQNSASSRWDVVQYGTRNTDSPAFHLTLVNATTMIAQIAVAHGLTLLGRTRHNTTLLQVDFRVRCRFAIQKMHSVEASLDLVDWTLKRTRKYPEIPGTLGRWRYQIESNAFVGETAILFLEKPGLTSTFGQRRDP
jgi:hypothetical protein